MDIHKLVQESLKAIENKEKFSERKFELEVVILTPVLGNSSKEKTSSSVLRIPSLKGQLRFWWRALYGSSFSSVSSMLQKEEEIFGGAGQKSSCSKLLLSSLSTQEGTPTLAKNNDTTYFAAGIDKINLMNSGRKSHTIGINAIALKSEDDFKQLKNTLCAWLLFGGIGGRTRKGAGALAPKDVKKAKELIGYPTEEDELKKFLEPFVKEKNKNKFFSLAEAKVFISSAGTNVEKLDDCRKEMLGIWSKYRRGFKSKIKRWPLGSTDPRNGKKRYSSPMICTLSAFEKNYINVFLITNPIVEDYKAYKDNLVCCLNNERSYKEVV